MTYKNEMDVRPLLNERGRTHGDFLRNAVISQTLKKYIREMSEHTDLKPEHKESLDMICLKISRILSGHANFKDHWDDIAGYAKLGSDACG